MFNLYQLTAIINIKRVSNDRAQCSNLYVLQIAIEETYILTMKEMLLKKTFDDAERHLKREGEYRSVLKFEL